MNKAKRLSEIASSLRYLAVEQTGARQELLRERHLLMGGDPNTTDEQILKEYYAPVIERLRRANT